jgi:hypothetical protein
VNHDVGVSSGAVSGVPGVPNQRASIEVLTVLDNGKEGVYVPVEGKPAPSKVQVLVVLVIIVSLFMICGRGGEDKTAATTTERTAPVYQYSSGYSTWDQDREQRELQEQLDCQKKEIERQRKQIHDLNQNGPDGRTNYYLNISPC